MPTARSRPRTVPVRIRARRDIDLGLCCCHAAAPGVRRDTSPDPRWSPNTHTGSGFSCGYYLIRAGASGVLSKRGSPAALVDSIRAVAAGATVTCQPVPGEDAEERAPDQTRNCLSAREEQVLRQISRGLTHGQVARRLGISPH